MSGEACDVDLVPVSDVDADLLTSYSKLLAENIELRAQLDKSKSHVKEHHSHSQSPRKNHHEEKSSGPKYSQCGETLLMLKQLNKRVTTLRQHQSMTYSRLEDSLREQESVYRVEPTDLFPVPLEKTVPDVVMEELKKRAELQAEIVVLKRTISRLELVSDTEKNMRMSYLETLARAEAAESDLFENGEEPKRRGRADSLPPPISPDAEGLKSPRAQPLTAHEKSKSPGSPPQRRVCSVILSPPTRHLSNASSASPQSSLRHSQRLVEENPKGSHARHSSLVSTSTSTRFTSQPSPLTSPIKVPSSSTMLAVKPPESAQKITPIITTTPASPVSNKPPVKAIDGQLPEKEQQELIRQWLNDSFSINVPEPTDDPTVFWQAFGDGVVLLEVIDKVRPGMVNWFAIAKPKPGGRPLQMFQRLSNCSMAAQLLEAVLPALHHVDGKDISDMNKKLLIAIFQEMVRSLKPK